MQKAAKSLLALVIVALLLSWMSGPPRADQRGQGYRGSRQGRHVLGRLRRCRGNNPAHHPVRPCKNAVLPPDDDDDDLDPLRLHAKAPLERGTTFDHDSPRRSFSPLFGSRPLPTEVARHQTLCILLI